LVRSFIPTETAHAETITIAPEFAVPGCLFHGGTIRLRMNIDEY